MIRFAARLCLIALLALSGAPVAGTAFAQDTSTEEADSGAKTQAVIDALSSLLRSQAEKQARVEELNQALKNAAPLDKEALEKELKAVRADLDQIDRQFDALSTGGAASKFSLSDDTKIDLQSELEQLVQPLVVMLKMATADSRRIELLRHSRFVAETQFETAAAAVESLRTLARQNDSQELASRLIERVEQWESRRKSARDLITSIDRQLEARLEGRETAVGHAGAVFTGFLRNRGLSFLYGLGAFFSVIIVMQFARRIVAPRVPRRISGGRSFRGRLIGLTYHLATVLIAIGAMLYIFNMRDDWLLLALSTIFLIAIGWITIKMLPNLVEQIFLLLNLGAVQEDERVVFNGVPWLVTELSYYTTLENPLLSAGTVTLPVRELIGLHSRPLAPDEEWFPCREGEWIKLADDHFGEVIFQSPDMVQVRLLGGAVITYTTSGFLEQNPINLSRDFRVELEFGIDYKHQAVATTEIPEQIREMVEEGLREILAEGELVGVRVDFLRAGDSSLDYEVEADVRGRAAPLYEEIERAMAKLLVEAANRYGWVIPFPQMTVHRSA